MLVVASLLSKLEAEDPNGSSNRLVLGELRLNVGEVHLELMELGLEDGDDANAAIDGVLEYGWFDGK